MVMSALLALNAAAFNTRESIIVISDPHLLSPELISPGEAINRADASDSKMMAQSDDIMSTLTDSIINLKPAVVLITGDLTYNGERASHERMAWHLSRLAQHGICPLVIPGNHDCNNPYSRQFDGGETRPAATITRDEFAQIYHDYGYSSASERDHASLSYCSEPIPGIVIIGIDSNMDELNTLKSRGDSTDRYYNGGRIKAETLQWIVQQATTAREQGKQVIAMMHHHLVPHFDQQDRLMANYIVKDHDDIARQFTEAGIHTIFTGHLHVTDAATLYNNDRTDSIVEVATGSSICYPFAIRMATLDQQHRTLNIDTRWLDATTGCPTLREQGRARIIKATPGMMAMMSDKAWSRLGSNMTRLKQMLEMGGGTVHLPETPQQATQLALRHLNEVLSRAMLAVVEGNEQEADIEDIIAQGEQGIRSIIEEVAPDMSDNLWEFFQSAVYPRLDPLFRSILEDRNAVGKPTESRTDDLHLTITL